VSPFRIAVRLGGKESRLIPLPPTSVRFAAEALKGGGRILLRLNPHA
jgi:hypothetical protein